MKPIEIGSRLELLVDDYLLERVSGEASFRLHEPQPREVVFPNETGTFADEPGRGLRAGHAYMTVFRDDALYRMYYGFSRWPQGLGRDNQSRKSAMSQRYYHYAESDDGLRWRTPSLGLFEYGGSADNNIVWCGSRPDTFDAHSFSPFRDDNPAADPARRYKALAYLNEDGRKGLTALASADGLRWSRLKEGLQITEGAFDSQNLAFWDGARGVYRAYWRDFFPGPGGARFRGVKTAVSDDFLDWGKPQWLSFPGAEPEQLYTNQVIPYFRAPHILVGLPTRYVARPASAATAALPEQERRRRVVELTGVPRIGTDLTDTLFMSSRDGVVFKRWGEAFIRPGLRGRDNWFYGDNYANWGIVTTDPGIPGAPAELTFYLSEGNRREEATKVYRRYTLRQDGFVSVRAAAAGGEVLTRPLVVSGGRLLVNFSASAAGRLEVELQDEQGVALPGFALADCVEVLGDDLEREISWSGGADLRPLAGRPVRVRFRLADADLYAFRFGEHPGGGKE